MLERVGRRRAAVPLAPRPGRDPAGRGAAPTCRCILVGYARTQDNSVTAEAGRAAARLRGHGVRVRRGRHPGAGRPAPASGRSARALPYELWYAPAPDQLPGAAARLRPPVQQRRAALPARPGAHRLDRRLRCWSLAALLWGRLVAPLLLNLRHRLRVADVVGGEPGHHLDLPDRPSAAPARPARRAVLPLAVPDPGLLVAVAPVLALRRRERPLAAADRQGGRPAHRRSARPRPGHPGLGGGPLRHLHRRAPDPGPGPADRRWQRHRPDPGDAGGVAARRGPDLPGPYPGRRAAAPRAGLARRGPADRGLVRHRLPRRPRPPAGDEPGRAAPTGARPDPPRRLPVRAARVGRASVRVLRQAGVPRRQIHLAPFEL